MDISELNALQRILLKTDGTLTDLLETYFLEKINLVKLSEEQVDPRDQAAALAVETSDRLVDRRILLCGASTGRNFIYAESIIALDRFDASFKDELLLSQKPLGRLWIEHKLETFKEMIAIGREKAGGLACHFNIAPDEDLLFRSYRVFHKGRPVIVITEKFPEHHFA